MEKDIFEEIKHKKESWDRVRNYKIERCKRFVKYESNWDSIFFIFNFEVILLFILSIYLPTGWFCNFITIFSGAFSIYVILLQYQLSKKNYPLKIYTLTSLEMKIETYIVELKNLYRNVDEQPNNVIDQQFQNINEKYNLLMMEVEPHDSSDQPLAFHYSQNCDKKCELVENAKKHKNCEYCDSIPLKRKRRIKRKYTKNHNINMVVIYSNYAVALILGVLIICGYIFAVVKSV